MHFLHKTLPAASVRTSSQHLLSLADVYWALTRTEKRKSKRTREHFRVSIFPSRQLHARLSDGKGRGFVLELWVGTGLPLSSNGEFASKSGIKEQ